MASLADMTVTLGLDDKDFVKGINNAENSVKKFGSTSEKEINRTTKLFETLKSALAGIAAGALIADTAKLNTEIVNTAKALNISTAAAIAFQKATAAAGGDADNARDALISLSQKLGEASTSGGDALAAFNEMGISLKDITTNSPEAMILKTVKAMAALTDSTVEQSIRSRLMGEDWKNVNLPEFIKQLEQTSIKAQRLAPAYQAAQRAQLQFNQAFADFQDQLTMAIPWDSMASSLKVISENMDMIGGSIKGILEIGAAFLFVSKIMVPLRNATAELAGGFEMMGGVLSWLKTHVIVGTFGPLLESFKDIGAVLFGTGPLLARFGTSLAGLFGFGSKAAVLYLIADGFNEIVKSITGVDVIGKLDELTQSIARFFGIAYQTEYHKKVRDTALKQASEEAIEAEKKRTEATARTSKLLQDQQKALAQIHAQYKQQNEQAIAKLELDNSLIGSSEEQKRIQSELMNIENQRQQVVQGLNDKIYEATDPSQIQGFTKAIEDTNKAFSEQKETVATLMLNAQEKELIARLQNVADEKYIDNQKTIRGLANEQANIFLPAIEQEYRNIEQAAEDAYQAMLNAEKVHWAGQSVENIPNSVKEELKALAYQNVQAEKDRKKSIEESNNAIKYTTQLKQLQLDQERQLSDIQQEIAYTTMPAYEQIAAKINYSAKQRIDDAIREVEESRKYPMTLAERAQWTDMLKGKTDELIAKQQESYKVSRQWNTGWTKAMNDYIENATNAAKVAENVFSKAMSGLEDAFISFTKTGKFEWKSFVNSMVEELLRAQFRQLMASMFTGITGGQKQSSGGVLSNLFSGFFADGGTIGAGKWGIVGEAGPEIVNGPATVTPMKDIGGSSNNITYNINAVDARSFQQMIAADPSFLYAVTEQGRRRLAGAR